MSKLAIGLVLILVGCAAPQPQTQQLPRYTNYSASQDQFMKDRYACYMETQQRVSAVSG